MSDKIKIIMCVIVTFLIIITSYILFGGKEKINEEDNIYISEVIKDECTEEYEQYQKVAVTSVTEEKLSSNAILILKKYYKWFLLK